MNTILQSLEQISRLLQTASSAAELAGQLGEITTDSRSEITVQPKDPHITHLSVVTLPNSAEPAHIRLRLAQPLSISALSEAFGAPRKAPPTPQGKVSQIFNAAYRGESHHVTVIAEGSDLTSDLVLRRDIRLD